MLHVVILTGSRNQNNPLLLDAGPEGAGLESKVLLPVFGKPMAQWVLDAVAACPATQNAQVYVSTNDPAVARTLTPSIPYRVIPSEARAVASFLKSVERVDEDAERVLFISGDHALVTPEMITHFVDESIARDLVLGVAAVNKYTVDKVYPESRRTYMPLKNGAFSGANMYLVHKPRFMGNPQVLETIDANRKAPWKSIFMLDPWSILRVFTRQADIHDLAKMASTLIGCKTGVVDMPFAEACMDVDKLSDKLIAERILAARQNAITPLETPQPSAIPA